METVTRILEMLRPWEAAAVAAIAALLSAILARLLRQGFLAAIAGGIGALAGWWFVFGLLTASPRQLPERLPLLMLALLLATPVLVLLAQRWRHLAWPAALLGALGVGWWMAGAPLVLPDLRRGAAVLAGVALGTLLLAARGGPRWAMPIAAAVLFGGILAASVRGPDALLAAALAAAAAGAALVPPRGMPAAPLGALPLAGGIAALAALPVIARGAPADWAAAASPLAALWLGAPLGGMVLRRGGGPLGAALVGGACAALGLLLR